MKYDSFYSAWRKSQEFMVAAGGGNGLSRVYDEFSFLLVVKLQSSLLYNAQVLMHMWLARNDF